MKRISWQDARAKNVLAKHYKLHDMKMLKEIFDKADLKVLNS